MTQVRTRFAPSPTGHLHIGGARTALFNYLFAQGQRGVFILRIEDTDTERSTQEYLDSILESLQWLGITWDDGPYFQTRRTEIYERYLAQLQASGHIYYCTCSPEELEEMRSQALARGDKVMYNGRCRTRTAPPTDRPYVVRLRTPDTGETVVDDLIKGPVRFPNAEQEDFIIRRSNGVFTFLYAGAVDDIEMRITHVLRGDDHLNNTPRQLLLYQALGGAPPAFGHMPLILGADRTRLSKRHGATSVKAYRDQGFLPRALVNYLARLGWAAGDQEIFPLPELIEKFSIAGVGKSSGVFDMEKLLWLNSHYLRELDLEKLAALSRPFFAARGYAVTSGDDRYLRQIKSLQPRARTLSELAEAAAFYYREEVEYNAEAAAKYFTPELAPIFVDLTARLSTLEDFSEAALEAAVKELLQEKNLKLKALAQPLRVALTGSTISPGLYETMAALGQEKTVARLNAAQKRMAS